MAQFTFDGIGTKWQIDIFEDLSEIDQDKLLARVKNRIEVFDKNYSRFRDDSLVTKMSKETGVFALPDDAEKMFTLYYDLYKITDGYFTPLVGNILSDAGYDAKYTLKQKKELEKAPIWEDVMEYKFPNIEIKKPVILDFGAGGKGYLLDLVAKEIEASGIFEYCIDAGGDILHKNKVPTRVGLENPENTEEAIGVYNLQNKSIAGSAGNRRAWGNFTHIMNPKTLISPRDIIAVWVVAETGLVADALATCLFFVPVSTLSDKYKFEYVLVKKDHSIEKSSNFKGEMFLKS
ncbi:FAD:protein FMN transferase [Candidatus Nomurabacteria bacterium]|nr:FAD:protein FMN transferase [Candidatus Nomurabacteria bacterium]